MTKPRYPHGCAAGSQEMGEASSSVYDGNSDNAWLVNFNNGETNINDRNNKAFVRPVRVARQSQGVTNSDASFRDLYRAWRNARKNKKPSADQANFDTRWIDGLFALQRRINDFSWRPQPSRCFVAARPKAREIHAPAFSDRVVHHWLVPQLEAIFEPGFIFDSYSNRKGKGTHAAVDRLRDFVRQTHSGEGGGWYLQLDIRNCFNSIHRPTLWRLLKRQMDRACLPQTAQRATHALVRHSAAEHGVIHCASIAERASVPVHKRLESAAAGCGLAIGNLSSQFFANAYLDALDQFVKHELKAKRYLRYVDDFVLVHHDRAQLEAWRLRIADFLRTRLRLELKADQRLLPLRSGIDFLGYVIYPTHTRVRKRVVRHAREALHSWARGRIHRGHAYATPHELRQLASIWASYHGHFRHADSSALLADFHSRLPWLHSLTERRRRFDYRLDHAPIRLPIDSAKPTT